MAEQDERQTKKELEKRRRSSPQGSEYDIINQDDTSESSRKRALSALRRRALKTKAAAAKKAREELVPESTWLLIIGLAATKDFLDIVSLDLLSWIDWVVDILLGFLLFLVSGRGAAARLRNAQRSILTAAAEMIPFMGIFPIWTISTFMLKQKEQNKSEKTE